MHVPKGFTTETRLDLSEETRNIHLRLEDRRQARRRREQEEAQAKGFASWEDEWNHKIQEDERRLDEYCARRGITREQHAKEKAARYQNKNKPRKHINQPCFAPLPPPCDCKEHLVETFCRKALVDYRSMDLHPRGIDALEGEHHVDLNQIPADLGGPSHRLSSPILEEVWQMDSPSTETDMPFWAPWDGVVQQILNGQHEEDNQGSSDTSSQPSRHDSFFSDDMSELGRTAASPTDGETTRRTTLSESEVKANLQEEIVKAVRSKSRSRSLTRSPSPIGRGRARRKSTSNLEQSPSPTITKVRKSQSVPARPTRSHKNIDFLELRRDGKPQRVPST